MSYMLVVDDEDHICRLITSILRKMGYPTATARSGTHALALLKQDLPLMLLTDLNMPDMTGLELIGFARQDFPNLPIIAVSAYTDYVHLALRMNKVYYVQKPFSRNDLVDVVNKAMATPLK